MNSLKQFERKTMKQNLLLLLAVAILLFAAINAKAQTKKDSPHINLTSVHSTGGYITLQSVKVEKDTVPCYFQVITGIVKGNLMGTWIKGWIVKPKGYNYIISSAADYELYREKYLYQDKKTLVKKTVINHYTANE